MNVRTVVLVLGLFSVLSTAAGGYLYYRSVKESALRETEKEFVATNEGLRDDVVKLVSFNYDAVKALAGFEQFQEALVDNQNKETLLQANRILDHFVEGLGYDSCFLIDSSGNCIGSSNRNQPDSFVGVNYLFRKYFQGAIQGRPSVELAVGLVTGIRGIFVSYPVYLSDGANPLGVVVIKVSTRELDRVFFRVRNMMGLLVNNDGMIFVSSRENWILKVLWRLSPEELARIGETKQFGKGPWNWTGLEKKKDNQVVEVSGADYSIREMSLENCPGWRIVSLYSYKTLFRKIFDPLGGKTGYIAFIVCLMVGGAVIVLYTMAQRDILGRKKSEEELQKERDRAQLYLDVVGVLVVALNVDGLVVLINNKGCEVLGYNEDEILNKNWFDVCVQKEIRAEARGFFEKLLAGVGAPVEYHENPVLTKDGEERVIAFHYSLIRDQAGPITGVLFSGDDITERRMVAEAQRRLFTAVEQAAEAVIITDATGIIQYVNPAQEILSGYSSDELIGQTPNIFKSDEYDDSFYWNLWATINAGNVWSGRFINRKKDGTEYHEDASISPVYDETGKLTNFVAVKRDVTKQLLLQEQLFQSQKMEAIGTLAGGFAHDFNNKLQIIKGYLNLVLFNKNLPDTVRSDLELIKEDVNSSAELITGMMVFSRKASVKLESLNLNNLVAHFRSMLSPVMPKMINIDIVLTDDIWTINAVPNQIDQILMNLAVNARDAMPDGGRLTIQTRNVVLDDDYCLHDPVAKPGRYVLIEVSDTGTGMDKETANHIFEPFFTTKESGKGTGLGLSVVYGIVDQHGGRIICDSEPSVGTSFSIYFPAIQEAPVEQYSENKEPPRGQGETILVVDDEPGFLKIASRLLMEANYRVIKASNGKDALELYEKHREEIGLVVLDLLMPVMGGKECLQALLSMDPRARVLLVSGFTQDGETKEALDSGARGFIGKPFDIPQFLEKIRTIIDDD